MPRVRSIQLKEIHQTLFHSAQDWSSLQAKTLMMYAFYQGIKHALSIQKTEEAQSLLLDFSYDLDRLRECTSKHLTDLIRDFEAVNVYQKDNFLALWIEFLQSNAHLLALERPMWSADRILFQRAMEHADQSPITHKAEEWVQNGSCDWVWWRRMRRPVEIPVQPCVSTFLTSEEEWSSFGAWNDLMVAMDSGSMLWIWDQKNNEVLLEIEVDNYSTESKDVVLYWTDDSIFMWTEEERESSLVYTSEEEIIDHVVWLSANELLVTTVDGNQICVNIESSSHVTLFDFGDSRNLQTILIDENTFIVYQDGWNDEYDEDDEDEEEEYDKDDEEDGEYEEEEERPNDPAILLVSRTDSSSDFASRTLHTVEEGICAIQKMGNHLLIVDKQGEILLLDSSKEELVHSWSVFEGTGADIYILSSSLFCVSQWDGEENFVLHLFSMDDFSVRTLEGHSDLVTSMRRLRDGRALSTSFDSTAIVWDCDSATSVFSLRNSVPHDFSGSVQLDEHTVALWSVSGEISIWDLRTQQQVGTLLGHTSSVSDVALLSNGYLVSSAMFEPSLRIWDPKKAPTKPPLDNHKDVIIPKVYNQGDEILTASHDETLRIWNRESVTCVYVCTEHTKPLECMSWVAEGEVISGDRAGVLLHWNRNGDVLHKFEGHKDWVRGFHVLSESRLLSWSDDATLRIWDRSSGDEVAVLEGHEEGVRGGFLLEENRWLSWSEDATIRIWDLSEGTCTCTLEGHEGFIYSVYRLGADKLLSHNREDMNIACEMKIWDTQTGECLQTYTGLDSDVIEWHIENECLFVRTYSHCWMWTLENPTEPTMWTLDEFPSRHAQIWDALHQEERLSFGDGYLVGKDNILTMHGAQQKTHWVAEGTWKAHKGFDSGMVLATCWKELAFLQLHRGAHPISTRDI